ncbi:RmlC-like cupin domain-containing protein [Aspergillus karnatakaensis]|uniref:germin family protein n=1 Tax=Aspergillus karnatakaensis TaxID=1810916 RepID=UPI003CCE2AF8
MLLQTLAAAILALALQATAAPQHITQRDNSDLSLTAQLRLADTATERYALLPDDKDFVFDFYNTDNPIATTANFPPLVGTGISFNVGQLPACSMSFVHLHPRATELFNLVSGHVLSEMIPESVFDTEGNQRVIKTELNPGQLTIFPAGSFHTQINPDCEPANFTAAFTSDEFSVSMVARQVFSFTDDVISATFGQTIAGEDIEKVRDAIPTTLAIKVEECLSKCGKEKR